MLVMLDVSPVVVKDLEIAKHPPSVKEKEERSILEQVKSLFGESIIHGRWLSNYIGQYNSFRDVLDEHS